MLARYYSAMRSAVARWSVFLVAAVIVAVLGVFLGGWVTDVRGVGAGVTAVTGTVSPLVLAGAFVVVATAAGVVVGRASNAAVGLFIVGWGIACLAMRTTGVSDLVFDGASFRAAFTSGIAIFGFALASSMAVFRMCGPLPDMPRRDEEGRDDSFRPETIARMAAASLVAIPIVWLVVRNDLRGQAIGGAAFAGAMVAFAMRIVGQGRQPVLIYSLPILAIVLVQLFGAVPAKPDDAFVAGSISPLARVMPLDLLGGIFMGVSVGLGLSRSSGQENEVAKA